MKCEDCDATLWEFHKHELESDQAAEVQAHLDACDACRTQADAVRRLVEAAGGPAAEEPSDALCLDAKAAVRTELQRQGRGQLDFGPVMDAHDLAQYLKVDVAVIHDRLEEIPHFDLGGHVRFTRSSIDDWIQSREHARYLFSPLARSVG